MVRTQIQLPDEIYRQLKDICRQREWTLAEAIRRAAERLIETHPPARAADTWTLPPARALGPFIAGPQDWRELANTRDVGKP